MGNIGNIWISIGAKIDDFQKNMSAVDKAMVKVGDKFQDVGKRLTIAGGAITAAMGLVIARTTKLGDEFDDLRQRTGIATETLSSFSLAVNKTDMGMSGFATALKFLANNMADANAGAKASVDKFAMLGVSFKDAAGNLRPLDQVMLDVADKFKAMPDGAQKSALAVDLFGRAGTSMIHMLNLGRDGLQAEMDKAKELGLVFTGTAAAAADAFGESLVDLKGGLQGAGNQIAMSLIPALTILATKVTETIGKVTAWMQAHPGLTKAISGTVLGIGGLMTALGTLSFAFGTVLKHIPTFLAGLKAIKAIALNPIVITIAVAIPVLTKALSDFKSEFNNMRDAMREAGSSGFISFLEGVNSGFRKVALGIKDSNIVMSEANDKFISLKGAGILLGDAFNAVKGAFAAAVTPAAVLSSVFKDFGLKTKTELTDELKGAEAALTLLRGSVEKTPGQVEVLEGKISALKEAINGSGEAAKLAAEKNKEFAASIQAIVDKVNPELAALQQNKIDQEALRKAMQDGVGSANDLAMALDRLVQAEVRLLTTTPQIKNALEDLAATNAKDVVPGLIDMADHFPAIPAAAQPAIEQTKGFFDGLYVSIAQGFGNCIASWGKDLLDFKSLFANIWDMIKQTFFTKIGEMITGWLLDFIAPAKKAVEGLGKSVGDVVGGAGKAAGSMASSFLTAASSIANIVTAVASVVALLKSPPTGAGDGMGRVVERQDQQTAILGSILEFQRNDERWGWQTSIKVLENIAYEKLKQANEYLKTIATNTGNITGHASGYSGVVSKPTLFVAGERGAEHVQVTPMNQSNTRPAIYITPVVIPRGDKYIIEFLTGAMRHGQMRVPAGAVGG